MRGGVSGKVYINNRLYSSSPRAWGCFDHPRPPVRRRQVFPTCVGVFLYGAGASPYAIRLPHVRGGVSKKKFEKLLTKRSSPRAWGCFRQAYSPCGSSIVFPTCVGVFPTFAGSNTTELSLPHVRGGVSVFLLLRRGSSPSSPRAWGCFQGASPRPARLRVFPTCVGVFPGARLKAEGVLRLPHVRGGVSMRFVGKGVKFESSPRAWGCFREGLHQQPSLLVFPTCVGVFLSRTPDPGTTAGLPHVRGGVSHAIGNDLRLPGSSPRAWGCFYDYSTVLFVDIVFPTCVGVFPRSISRFSWLSRLPHVRGGVSFIAKAAPVLGTSSPRAWGCFSVCYMQLH